MASRKFCIHCNRSVQVFMPGEICYDCDELIQRARARAGARAYPVDGGTIRSTEAFRDMLDGLYSHPRYQPGSKQPPIADFGIDFLVQLQKLLKKADEATNSKADSPNLLEALSAAKDYYNTTQGRNDMKKVRVKSLANDSIMEIEFVTIPRKGYFKDNIQPIIDVLKAQIPATQRTYDPTTHKWEMAMEYWAPFKIVLESLGFTIDKVKEHVDPTAPHVPQDYADNFYNAPAPTKEPQENIASALSEIMGVDIATLGDKELKNCYRAACRKHHPDFGGDAAKMSELNRLWSLYNAKS